MKGKEIGVEKYKVLSKSGPGKTIYKNIKISKLIYNKNKHCYWRWPKWKIHRRSKYT